MSDTKDLGGRTFIVTGANSGIGLEAARAFTPSRAYQQYKLANLLFTLELQRRLREAGSSIGAHAAHPGYSATNLQTHHANPLMNKLMWVTNKVTATSAEFGPRPTVHAATRSTQAQNSDVARDLWDVSEQRTGTTSPRSLR